MNPLTKKLVTYTICIVGGVLIALLFRGCGNDDADKVKLYEHLNDTTTFYKNKYNQQVARNTVLESRSAKTFLAIETKDKEILALQQLVKDYKKQLKSGGSATNFTTGTTINNTTGTFVVVDTFSIIKNDTVHHYPIYATEFENEWIHYNIDASKDSIGLKLQTTDKYSVVIGEERPKMFKKKVAFVDVISESPYTKVKSVKTYKVDDKRKPTRVSLGVQGGYGLTIYGATPYIGLGVQFNLLNIK